MVLPKIGLVTRCDQGKQDSKGRCRGLSVNPKTLVEKFIRDSKGRKRLTAITGMLAVFTVLITVGVLTFPAISISGSEEALREQGIDITTGQAAEEAEVVAPPADEAPIVAYDEASQAPDAESNENVAEAITEDSTIGDVVVSEGEEVSADAPAESEVAEGEEAEEATEEELDPEKEEAEEEVEASDAAKAALASADLSSQRLIVGSPAADALAKDKNVVASFDNVYLFQYANADEAAKGFLRFYDNADYVTPDVAVAIAEGEDNSDPEEEVITTSNVYTEEENPFAELEAAIVENEAEIAAEATKTDALIAVVDTGAATSENVVEAVSMLGEDATDDNGHGQRMVDYIVEENENARVLAIKALGKNGKGDVSAVVAAINYAVERGANIINLSASAYASEENAALADAVKTAEQAGVIVVGAAGNNGFNAKFYIPGNIEEATIVGAADAEGNRIAKSNFGDTVDFNVVAESTSESAARMSGFISAYGETGVYDVLNQGKIFESGYVAPVEEDAEEDAEEIVEEEAVEEDEEAPEEEDSQLQAAEVVSPASGVGILQRDAESDPSFKNWLVSQRITSEDKTTITVDTWDALEHALSQTNCTTIILGTGALSNIEIAAYKTLNVSRSVTIKAGALDTIYHDADPKSDMSSYFNVASGATLTLEGVTLSGKNAYARKLTNNDSNNLNGSTVELRVDNYDEWDIGGPHYEVEFYDRNHSNVRWIDSSSISNINKSLMAVKPGTANEVPDPNGKFAIRAKEKASNGNYLYLSTSYGNLKLFEVSDPATTDRDEYRWEINELLDGSTYLWSQRGGVSVSYNGVQYRKITELGSSSGLSVMVDRNSSYTGTAAGGYFVNVANGGTLTLKNAGIKHANLGAGQAPIYSNGGAVNVYDNSEISFNKVIDDVYNNVTVNSDLDVNDCSDGLTVAPTAGAINMEGGTLTIEGNGIAIHDNRGGASNAAGAIRLNNGTQASVTGDVKIYDNRARKNSHVSASGDLEECYFFDEDGNPDPEKLNARAYWGHKRWGWYYNVEEDGHKTEMQVTAWKSAGAILVDGDSSLTLGTASGTGSTPQLYGNTGEAGAIRVAGENSRVDQYVSVIGGDGTNPNLGTNGGAVHVDEGTYFMHSGEMTNNAAWSKGGAVTVTRQGEFIMGEGGTQVPVIADNICEWWGGGIYIESDNVTLNNGEIRGNISGFMGGGIYVQGDYLSTTYRLTFPASNTTNAYVYNNRAVEFLNGRDRYLGPAGDGGGLWFCKWGSYLYEEEHLEVFGNNATKNGDDFSKVEGNDGQGVGAGFVPVTGHTWIFDYERAGEDAFDENGKTLIPLATFPTSRYINLHNNWSTDTLPSSSNVILIYDNASSVGGGIGCNGVIAFRPLPMHYKTINADLELDKVWTSGDGDGKKVTLTVDLLDANDEEIQSYNVELDGKSPGSKVVDEENPVATSRIAWDKWHVKINLPTYLFNIDTRLIQELMRLNNWTEAQAKAALDSEDEEMIAKVDEAQKYITTKPINSDEEANETIIDYTEADGQGNVFVIDGYNAQKAFKNWKIKITEQVTSADGTETSSYYVMSVKDLYFEKKNADDDYSSKFVDTGHNFFIYNDTYNLSTDVVNTPTQDIKIRKTDGKRALQGAGFTLYDATTNQALEGKSGLLSDSEGYVNFGSLKPGNYYIKETGVPSGYAGYESKIFFSVANDGAVSVKRNSAAVEVADDNGQLMVDGQRLYVTADGAINTTTGSPLKLQYTSRTNLGCSPVNNGVYFITDGADYYVQGRKQYDSGGNNWDFTRPRVLKLSKNAGLLSRGDMQWKCIEREDGTKVLQCIGIEPGIVPDGSSTAYTWTETYWSYLYFDGNEVRLETHGADDSSIFSDSAIVTLESGTNGIVINVSNKELVQVNVTKAWENNDPKGNTSISVSLLSDLAAAGTYANTGMTKTLSAPSWSGSFTNLPYRAADGRVINYKVIESPVPSGFSPSYSISYDEASKTWVARVDNNTITLGGNLTITANKEWDENTTEEEKAGVELEFQLLSDYGQPGTKKVVGTVTVSSLTNWKGSWEGYPRFQADGTTPVNYEVVEVNVPAGFKVEYGPMTAGTSQQPGNTIEVTATATPNGYVADNGLDFPKYDIDIDKGGYGQEVAYCVEGFFKEPLHSDQVTASNKGTKYTRELIADANALGVVYSNYSRTNNNGWGSDNGRASNEMLYSVLLKAAYYGYPNDGANQFSNLTPEQFRYLTQYVIYEYTDFYSSKLTPKSTNAYGLVAEKTSSKVPENLRDSFIKLLELVGGNTTPSALNDMKLYLYKPVNQNTGDASKPYFQYLIGVDTAKYYQDVTVTNTAEKHSFELLKVDASKIAAIKTAIEALPDGSDRDAYITAISEAHSINLLNGATFTLSNLEGTVLQTATTSDGKLQFTELNPGNYILHETKAPQHYHYTNGLGGEKAAGWKVTIARNGNVTVSFDRETYPNAPDVINVSETGLALVVIANEIDTYKLPATGGIGTQVFMVIGGLLMLVAGVLFVRRTGRQGA